MVIHFGNINSKIPDVQSHENKKGNLVYRSLFAWKHEANSFRNSLKWKHEMKTFQFFHDEA